jgi:UDP-N-acetylmuramyl pentapeptide phosphotransferase/UDP-N-acetylglucosamine-1-phosphate transferase
VGWIVSLTNAFNFVDGVISGVVSLTGNMGLAQKNRRESRPLLE